MYYYLKRLWSKFLYWLYYQDSYWIYYSDSDEWEEEDNKPYLPPKVDNDYIKIKLN